MHTRTQTINVASYCAAVSLQVLMTEASISPFVKSRVQSSKQGSVLLDQICSKASVPP
jgi:hypothetical protein